MGGGVAITTHLAPWHWQDKFEARNPEEANRQQLLKIEKQISFSKWLNEKRKEERMRNAAIAAIATAKLEEEQEERDAKEKERKEDKRRQREDAKQRKDEQKARERAEAQQREQAKERAKRLRAKKDKVKHAYTSVMRCASQSESAVERPTFKEWMARKKRDDRTKLKSHTKVAKTQAELLHKRDDNEKIVQRAYDEWMARKQLEDRVKQKLSNEQKLACTLDEKLLHTHKWQKKAIVCAYSQNRIETTRGATMSLLS